MGLTDGTPSEMVQIARDIYAFRGTLSTGDASTPEYVEINVRPNTDPVTVTDILILEGTELPRSIGATGRDRDLAAVQPLRVVSSGDTTTVRGDLGRLIVLSQAAPQTVTIAPESACALPIGATISVSRAASGTKTLAPGSGVTLTPASSGVTAGSSYTLAGLATLVKIASNTWLVAGELA
ncbi:hypothetical protein [Citreimonas sp.]|uniref:hypothetical protein n=1 Tax=Citreimonas sp. TaxID=3036715 RepID=UPI0035C85EB9